MFWNDFTNNLKNIRIYDVDSDKNYSYSAFYELLGSFESFLSASKKKLILLFADNGVNSLAAYISALNSGHALILSNSGIPLEAKMNLISLYEPDYVISTNQHLEISNYKAIESNNAVTIYKSVCESEIAIYPDLALLLSTSGTTGNPKLVRLSYSNIQSNAESICEYLKIANSDVAITNLSLSYSYGLSVVNTHLMAGASIVCSNHSLMQKEFWKSFKELNCTSFAGVPFLYQVLEKLRFERMNLPSLKVMTQAGGRMSPDKIEYFNNVCEAKNIKLFIMYGQTEATARISYVPAEKLKHKISSIGVSIPDGKLEVIDNENNKSLLPYQHGELIYQGKNVMLGYAESRAHLAKGDEMNGLLRTGDIGYQDDEGFFYITGRLKRISKIYGQRINLDEVEKLIESKLSYLVGCLSNDEQLFLLTEILTDNQIIELKNTVSEYFKINPNDIIIKCLDALPISTVTGKKDYLAMKEIFGLK